MCFIPREFRIRLVQDRDTLSPQSVLSVDGETHPSEYSHIYQGHLEGQFLTVVDSVSESLWTFGYDEAQFNSFFPVPLRGHNTCRELYCVFVYYEQLGMSEQYNTISFIGKTKKEHIHLQFVQRIKSSVFNAVNR